MRLYGNIAKVDAAQRIVEGYASTECVDRAGEVVLKSAIEDALDDWLEFGNIRQMHQLSAVGKAVEASIDDRGLWIAAKIVDDEAWKKVVEKVYRGFSIGGKTLARDPDDKRRITKIRLDEISLVDRPANPEAVIDLWRAAGLHDGGDLAKVTGERDRLAKALADRDTAIGELADQVEQTFTKVRTIVADNQRYQRQIADLTKRLAEVQKPRLIVDNAARADQAFDNAQKAVADAVTTLADIDTRLKRLEGQ